MLLHKALDIKVNEVISFVGAGGKTTTALCLMEELTQIGKRVVFTTTTKILEPTPKQDEYLLLAGEEEALRLVPKFLARYPKVFLAQRCLEEVDLTALGESDRDYPMRPNKVDGVPPSVVDHLAQRLREAVILVEADGARHRALKAPAAYEPVVPDSTTILVPMADLTVLGKPLTEKYVHRPELVAGLTGATIGQPVTAEIVATVLSHPQGGLKGLPEQTRVVPILNLMAEDRPLGEVRYIARLILRNQRVERVVIASLRASEPVLEVMTNDQIPMTNRQSAVCNLSATQFAPAGSPDPAVWGRIWQSAVSDCDLLNLQSAVAAIVLAAGESRRFGQPKQLLPVGDKTMIQHVVDVALASPVEQVIVVLSCRAEEIRANIAGRPVQVVVNERWKSGLSTSVKAGLSAVKPEVSAALFILADQPGITPDIIARLIQRYQETRSSIVVPTHRGRWGNPVLFDRSLFKELMQVEGDQGGRQVIAEHKDEVEEIDMETETILADIDTIEDYKASSIQSPISNFIKSLIIDLDGVLYRGDEPIEGAREFIAFLQREGIPFLLLTNNSTRTPSQYVEKLAGMGIAIKESDVLTSAQATAMYLEKVAPPGAPVYAIGEDGLRAALNARYTFTEEKADFVVVGMDSKLTYEKLKIATLLIRGGARFIATNPDKTLPTEEGLIPGNGAILAALEAATGVSPLVIGKPEPTIFDLALARMGTGKEGAAVIGDRLETDILGGRRAGLLTILVLSGATSRQDLETSPVQPDLVFEDVKQLYEAWPRLCQRIPNELRIISKP